MIPLLIAAIFGSFAPVVMLVAIAAAGIWHVARRRHTSPVVSPPETLLSTLLPIEVTS